MSFFLLPPFPSPPFPFFFFPLKNGVRSGYRPLAHYLPPLFFSSPFPFPLFFSQWSTERGCGSGSTTFPFFPSFPPSLSLSSPSFEYAEVWASTCSSFPPPLLPSLLSFFSSYYALVLHKGPVHASFLSSPPFFSSPLSFRDIETRPFHSLFPSFPSSLLFTSPLFLLQGA